jgi:hypothetical protein
MRRDNASHRPSPAEAWTPTWAAPLPAAPPARAPCSPVFGFGQHTLTPPFFLRGRILASVPPPVSLSPPRPDPLAQFGADPPPCPPPVLEGDVPVGVRPPARTSGLRPEPHWRRNSRMKPCPPALPSPAAVPPASAGRVKASGERRRAGCSRNPPPRTRRSPGAERGVALAGAPDRETMACGRRRAGTRGSARIVPLRPTCNGRRAQRGSQEPSASARPVKSGRGTGRARPSGRCPAQRPTTGEPVEQAPLRPPPLSPQISLWPPPPQAPCPARP